MKSLTILESANAKPDPSEEHVMAFYDGLADSYPEDYMNASDVKQIEAEAFSTLIDYLDSKRKAGEALTYKQVDLMWCFKKRLLNYLCFVRTRHELFRRALEKHQPESVTLRGGGRSADMPYMQTILEAAPASKIPFSFAEGECSSAGKKGLPATKNRFFPSVFSWNAGSKRQIAVFSDQKKSRNIQNMAAPGKIVCYTHVKSPKLFLSTLSKGEGFFQADSSRAADQYKDLARECLATFRQKDYLGAFSWGNLDWKRLLDQRVESLFENELPSLLFSIDHMTRFFETSSSLQTALLDEDIAPEKNAFAQIARHYGVAAYVACHGALGKRTSYLPLTVHGIFVWGEAQKEKLMSWGCPGDRIHVTGCARYSSYQEADTKGVREEVLREHGLRPDRKTVLVGFMIARAKRRRLFDHKRKRALLDILEAARARPDVDFLIKIKNRFDEHFYTVNDWIQKHPEAGHVRMITDADSMRLVLAADIVVICNTTLGIEAFALGKPVISIFGEDCQMMEEFGPFDVFHSVDTAKGFSKTLDDLLAGECNDSSRRDAARRKCLNDGETKPEKLISSVLEEAVAR